MAHPVNFIGVNRNYVAAPGEEDRVGTLPVRREGAVTISCWELTPEELEKVKRTGRIYLGVFGTGQPPVYVGDEATTREACIDFGCILPRQQTKVSS